MKHSIKTLLVAAAMTGLLGAIAIPAVADDTPAKTDSKDGKDSAKAKAKTTSKSGAKSAEKDSKSASKDKNSCKGANGCGSADDKKN